MLTLTVGHTYRAKRPANSGGRVNDRTIVWKSQDGSLVQYDGPAVRFGAHYPKVTSGKFSEWAGEDVTHLYDKGDTDWKTWKDYALTKKINKEARKEG